MTADEAALAERYDLVKLNVASGTHVSTRAADVVKNLSKTSAPDKPIIVRLSTSSRNANKLISIVEIAKRELKAQNVPTYQYNALSSETIQVEREQKKSSQATNGNTEGTGEADDGSDDAFETMGQKRLDGPKKRVIPVMTTYLSTASVKELKASYG